MRTTIEINDEQRAMLNAIAARRGWRDSARVVEEAIEFYLQHHRAAEEARQALAERKGAWSEDAVEQTRDAIAQLREQWRAPSS